MRQASHLVAACLFAALLALPVRADEAKKILDEYSKAAGGGKALSKIQTLAIDGSMQSSGEETPGTYTFKVKRPNRLYTELRANGKTLIESYNGKSAWHQAPDGEISTLLGPSAVGLEAASEYYNSRLQQLAKLKIGVAYKGESQIRGRAARELELTYPTGVVWHVFFDPQTHLIVQEKTDASGVTREMDYDDYRVVEGLKVPYKIEIRNGDQVYSVTVTRVGVNETIGERVFDFPIKSQVKLPDLKALFEEIDANQKQIDKIKENYAGTRVEEETQYDKTGKVTKKELNEYTFFYLNGDEVSTLVKKDGKPLSEEEQKKENEKTQKEIADIQKRQKKEEEKNEKKEEKAKEEGKEANDPDDPGIEVFLRAAQFVNPRHERFRGQDVLVFDFEPNPEYKPKNLVEKVVKDLAGVIWIDEKAKDVVRLEAYFVGDFRFAGGMVANIQQGTSFVFEQAYWNDEVWLPTYEEAHVGVRVLMVKGFKMNQTTRYSDYKRFNVETLNTINQPKQAAAPATSSTESKPQ